MADQNTPDVLAEVFGDADLHAPCEALTAVIEADTRLDALIVDDYNLLHDLRRRLLRAGYA